MTPRYTQALNLAATAHEGQKRKGTPIPYISHPVAVAALVASYGGDEDQQIAALLHDVLASPRHLCASCEPVVAATDFRVILGRDYNPCDGTGTVIWRAAATPKPTPTPAPETPIPEATPAQ